MALRISIFTSYFFMCLDDCDRLDRQTQATTFIHQVFGGYLRSRGTFLVICLLYMTIFDYFWFDSSAINHFFPFLVKCLNCKAVSDTFDPFLDIPLEIKVIIFLLLTTSYYYLPFGAEENNFRHCFSGVSNQSITFLEDLLFFPCRLLPASQRLWNSL